MRRFLALTSALALGVICAVLLSSCGGSNGGGISAANAANLNDALDQIEQLANDGECSAAADTANAAAGAVSGAPSSSLDPKLKTALIDSFQRLATLTGEPGSGCVESATTTEETTTDETTTKEEPTVHEPTVSEPPTTTTNTTTNGTGGTGGGVVSP